MQRARLDSARGGHAPGDCAHSHRRPLMRSGLLGPVSVHVPSVPRVKATEQASHKAKHSRPLRGAHVQARAVRARIPPGGHAPGELCALTASQRGAQRSPHAGLGALAPCDQGKATKRVSKWGAADHTERHTHKRMPRARSD